jgi:phosphopantetheinyl transferase (holo-ACP synthase)
MLSTGNDIVSLNAVNKTRTKQFVFYSKILSHTEKELFDKSEFKSIPFENFVWLLWSIKESAYKYLQRITPDILFSPTKITVNNVQIPVGYNLNTIDITQTEGIGFNNMMVLNGSATYGSTTLYSSSILSSELILSVVNHKENFENVGWGVKLIDKNDPDYQSAAVRAFLVKKLNTLFRTDDLVILKTPDGIPIVMKKNVELPIPVSLSHHDRLIAYSYTQ